MWRTWKTWRLSGRSLKRPGMSGSGASLPSRRVSAGVSSSVDGHSDGVLNSSGGGTSKSSSSSCWTISRTLTTYGPPLRPSPRFVALIQAVARAIVVGTLSLEQGRKLLRRRLWIRNLMWRLARWLIPAFIGAGVTVAAAAVKIEADGSSSSLIVKTEAVAW